MDAARRDRIDHRLKELDTPVLLLRGAHDRIAPGNWLDLLAKSRPAAGPTRSTVTLPSGGHMVPLTRGRLVAEQVAGFA
jgi:pimeloyl-ACP methyl ester carboxylesterase